jgi:hypothetical protein
LAWRNCLAVSSRQLCSQADVRHPGSAALAEECSCAYCTPTIPGGRGWLARFPDAVLEDAPSRRNAAPTDRHLCFDRVGLRRGLARRGGSSKVCRLEQSDPEGDQQPGEDQAAEGSGPDHGTRCQICALIMSPTIPPFIPAGCRNPAPRTVALGYSSGCRCTPPFSRRGADGRLALPGPGSRHPAGTTAAGNSDRSVRAWLPGRN